MKNTSTCFAGRPLGSVIILLFSVLVLGQGAWAQTTFTVTNTNNAGTGSLRQAMLNVAASGSAGSFTMTTTAISGTIQTHALLPGCPAINVGTANGTPTTDQRGIARVGVTNIGSSEWRGFTLALSSGNNQAATVGTTFANPLRPTVSRANSPHSLPAIHTLVRPLASPAES